MLIPKPIVKSSKVTHILVSKLKSIEKRLATQLRKFKTSEKGVLGDSK